MDVTWVAQPRQSRFLNEVMDPNGADEILYGGAAGGGKTDALLIAAIIYAQNGGHVLFLRRTYAQLEGKPIPRSKQLIPRSMATYKESKRQWIFFSGGSIKFGYLEKKGDEENYQGHEYALIVYDELTHFDLSQYIYLLSRNRSTEARFIASGLKPKIIAASNPGSRGHAWVKGRWIDGHEPEVVWEAEMPDEVKASLAAQGLAVEPRKRVFIPAKLQDNQKLLAVDPGYLARLLELPESQQKMLLHGEWDYFEGMAFPEWKPDLHVCKPFRIPETWRRFRAVDYGQAAPFCCLWFAVDQDSEIWVYRELYGVVPHASDQASKIVELSLMFNDLDEKVPEKIDFTILDSACWAKNQFGESVAETYMNNGVQVWQADKNRLQGKARVHEWLKPIIGPDGKLKSRIHIFDTCKNLIEQLSTLPTDPNNPDDVDTDAPDHAYDTLRYGLMSRPQPPKRTEPEKTVIQRHKERIIKKAKNQTRRWA
ncbi:terminase large subunit domain-containing protein [Brevibacillus migulae]|uniref:terminase large subunit domain-containing protein n=1 Tax=Brevibacillus migulae TaxID=1644114 RepID=UPI00106E15A8|nr:terminase family protein [Brevibacillus migulae]